MENKRLYWVLAGVIVVIFAICTTKVLLDDKEAPIITINEEVMIDAYSDGMKQSELLKGVTAYDEVDGDVTDSLEVINVVVLSNGKEIQVTYVARDTHSNISKANAKVAYEGNKAFVDVGVGEESTPEQQAKTEAQTTEQPTTEQPTTPVYQLGGSGEPVKINREQVDSTGIPQIELKYTDYTIKKGQSFGSLEGLDLVNTTYDDKANVSNRIVIGNIAGVDVNTVGDYVLTYSVSDTEGNRSEGRELTIHVIE